MNCKVFSCFGFFFSDNGSDHESECSDVSVTEKRRYSGDPSNSSSLPISPSDVGPEDWDAELEASPPYGKKTFNKIAGIPCTQTKT